jgi:cyclic beta-1,2-glucan synthetase
MDFFQEAYEYFDESTKARVVTSSSAEWLLDNLYVVEQAVRQIEEDLPADYYQRLQNRRAGRDLYRCLSNADQETRLDLEAIRLPANVPGDTRSAPVTPALPSLLRLAVLESLVQGLADVTRQTQKLVSQPNIWEGIDVSPSAAPEPDPNVIVANSVLSLRLLGTQDWKAFFEATSLVEKILRADPAGLYPQMDFETRNRYRSVVEELARGSQLEEASIGRQALELASAAEAGDSEREKHVGYYLIAQGRETLEALINFRPRFSQAAIRFIQKNATAVYLGSIFTLTLFPSALILLYALQAGADLLQLLLLLPLSFFPLSSVAIELVNGLVVSIIPPRTLPKLNLERGVPVNIAPWW